MQHEIKAGVLLISDPFLKDPFFCRSTVLVCEHNEDGSFGLILNKKHKLTIGDVIEGLEGNKFPIGFGGPVHQNTLHFIHRNPSFIQGGLEIGKGIFWGGNFEDVTQLLSDNALSEVQIKFFIGYSGWSPRQLENELAEKSWITSIANLEIIFKTSVEDTWRHALKQMGGDYSLMVNFPIDPSLN